MHGRQAQDQGTEAHLEQLGPALYECAYHVTEGSFDKTLRSLRKISKLASIVDGPLQRLSIIVADSLARRLLCPIQGFTAALIDPSRYFEQSWLRVAHDNFANLSPYLSTGFVTMNRAILEQVQDEQVVRVIDLSCSTTHPWQWLKLLHDFRGLPRRTKLHLTVVHEDVEFLSKMEVFLCNQARGLGMSSLFHFDPVIGRLETLDFSNLRQILKINSGETVVISCALQMHRLLAVDDSVSRDGIAQLQQMANMAQLKQKASCSLYSSPASTLNYPLTPSPQRQIPELLVRFLSGVRALEPKILVMMEQDADHNAPLFRDRFAEALRYYAALFDSLHAVAARRADERVRVERMLLGEEIKNILVCEGVQRHERHERLSQWEMHMERCQFDHVPLSFEAIREGKRQLMSSELEKCGSVEDKARLLLCWGVTHLYSISAWRPHRS